MAVPCIVKKRLKTSGSKKLAARKKELHPHQRGHNARDDEEHQARADIHQPELLVIHRVDELLNDAASANRALLPHAPEVAA